MSKKIVLLYHRIAKVKDDPHLLAVSPENFASQIKWLKSIKNLEVNITFDDGYADNFYNALPILARFQTRATIFVVSSQIGRRTPFFWDNETKTTSRGRSLTKSELIRLAIHPLITIGAHTRSHPRLSSLSVVKQQNEIQGSKKDLETIIKKPVETFSYPFGSVGDFNDKTVMLVKQAGFKTAFVNWPGIVDEKTDPYQLPRFIVRDWQLPKFKEMFNIWT